MDMVRPRENVLTTRAGGDQARGFSESSFESIAPVSVIDRRFPSSASSETNGFPEFRPVFRE